MERTSLNSRRCSTIFAVLAALTFVTMATTRATARPMTDALASMDGPTSSVSSSPTSAAAYDRYGWTILGIDGAMLGISLAVQNPTPSLLTYLFSGPLIHLGHNNGSRALTSFALRLTLPLLGAVLATASDDNPDCPDGHCSTPRFMKTGPGLLAGAGAAILIDTLILAKTRRKTTDERPGKRQASHMFTYGGVSATPNLGASRDGGMTAGLTGSF